MEYTLYKLPQGFIVTSDEEVKNEDCYLWDNRVIKNHIVPTTEGNYMSNYFHKGLKIIAQQDRIIFNISEKEQKEIGWFDVEKMAKKSAIELLTSKDFDYPLGYVLGYNDGFQKALELLSDKEFTKEDVEKAIYFGSGAIGVQFKTREGFIQSLNKASWKIQLEMEDLYEEDLENNVVNTPKLTNGKITITKILS